MCQSGYINDHGLFIKVLGITGKNSMIAFTRVRTSKLLITFIKVKTEKREIRYQGLPHSLYLSGKLLP